MRDLRGDLRLTDERDDEVDDFEAERERLLDRLLLLDRDRDLERERERERELLLLEDPELLPLLPELELLLLDELDRDAAMSVVLLFDGGDCLFITTLKSHSIVNGL